MGLLILLILFILYTIKFKSDFVEEDLNTVYLAFSILTIIFFVFNMLMG